MCRCRALRGREGVAAFQLLLGQPCHSVGGQVEEAKLLPTAEQRDEMLTELRKVIPAFLVRVDQPDRGGKWSEYLAQARQDTAAAAAAIVDEVMPEPRPEVSLTDFDPEGEVKIVASALYAVSDVPDDQLMGIARKLSAADRAAILRAYVGNRTNRRHRPGRAFERSTYRFDVLTDYGAFRDLQRHRLLTLEWQPLSPHHGYVEPEAISETGAGDDWARVMDGSAELHDAIVQAGLKEVAPYAVAMAYRVRFYMEMNAREAMHVIELRSAPQGHPAYRRVCQEMHLHCARAHSRRQTGAVERRTRAREKARYSALTSRSLQYRPNSSRNVNDSNDRIRSKKRTPSR